MGQEITKPLIIKTEYREDIINSILCVLEMDYAIFMSQQTGQFYYVDLGNLYTVCNTDDFKDHTSYTNISEIHYSLGQEVVDFLISVGKVNSSEYDSFLSKIMTEKAELRKLNDISKLTALIHQYPDIAAQILAT